MKPILSLAAVAAASIALVVAPANAANGNPHFIKNASSATLSGANLNCNFKEAGLASGSVETITCNAQESVAYECVNGAATTPAASHKRTFPTAASKTVTVTADKTCNLFGRLSLVPPRASRF